MIKEFSESTSLGSVRGWQLENPLLSVRILSYGAIIQSFVYRPFDRDIVLGFDTIQEYIDDNHCYLGATIGRVANRIKGGRFTLGETEYRVPVNNGPNSLHGGLNGFDKKIFAGEIKGDQLILTYVSASGEEGYPGELSLTLTFSLKEDSLSLNYKATSDQDTLFAPTQHSYFNLNGSGDILGHRLYSPALQFGAVDEFTLPTGELLPVAGTPFDFTRERMIGKMLAQSHPQLTIAKGFDHHFCVPHEGKRLFATLSNEDLYLKIYSSFPGFQLYSGNYLDLTFGKASSSYKEHSGICLETQYFPDNIHNQIPPLSILKQNETFVEETTWQVLRREA